MTLLASERARARHFLGYPSIESVAASMHLGVPAVSQPAFVVDAMFDRISVEGEEAVRRDLCQLEDIEAQLGQARGRMKAKAIGELEINPAEAAQLRGELVFWTRRLADDLGVVPSPYAQMHYMGMPGGVSGKSVG